MSDFDEVLCMVCFGVFDVVFVDCKFVFELGVDFVGWLCEDFLKSRVGSCFGLGLSVIRCSSMWQCSMCLRKWWSRLWFSVVFLIKLGMLVMMNEWLRLWLIMLRFGMSVVNG